MRKVNGQMTGTVCKRIAPPDVRVEYVDFDEAERKRTGYWNILDPALAHEFDAKRERHWVACVVAGTEWPVLFVCGAWHVESIRGLFGRVGVPAIVVQRDFDPARHA